MSKSETNVFMGIEPIPTFNFKFIPTSSKAIVTSVLISVVFVAVAQIAERLDVELTDGSVLLFGNINLFIWLTMGCLLFGLTGGLIVANINPIVANIAQTTPLAPIWFIENTSNALLFIAMLKYFKVGKEETSLPQYVIAGLCSFPGLIPELIAIPLIFGKSIEFMLIASVLNFICVGIGSTIGFFITRSVITSKFFSELNESR